MAASPDSHRAITSPSVAKLAIMPAPARVRFGPYALDTKAGELRLGAHKIILPDQPHKILLLLIERRGDIVTREEIQKSLWSDDVIVSFEVSINQAIRKLRRALNDSAEEPKYVETIGRRGYRLMVPVVVDEPENSLDPVSASGVGARLLGLVGREQDILLRADDMRVLAAALVKLMNVLAVLESSAAQRSTIRSRTFQPRLVRHWK